MELAGESATGPRYGICAAGAPEVRENGEWLAGLEGVQYEVSAQSGRLFCICGAPAIPGAPRRAGSRRIGRTRRARSQPLRLRAPAQLEFVAGGAPRETRRVEREQFSLRLRRILTDHFPDETVESLATAADLRHSLSGSYTRGIIPPRLASLRRPSGVARTRMPPRSTAS